MRKCAAVLLCLVVCSGCGFAEELMRRGESLHDSVSANVYPISGSVQREVYELKRTERSHSMQKSPVLKETKGRQE